MWNNIFFFFLLLITGLKVIYDFRKWIKILTFSRYNFYFNLQYHGEFYNFHTFLFHINCHLILHTHNQYTHLVKHTHYQYAHLVKHTHNQCTLLVYSHKADTLSVDGSKIRLQFYILFLLERLVLPVYENKFNLLLGIPDQISIGSILRWGQLCLNLKSRRLRR